MSITPGFTTAEIREFVYEYHTIAHEGKTAWLAERRVSSHMLRRWRDAVFAGDLDRGLIPREGSEMTIPSDKRTALAKLRAAEREDQATEVARLNGRVRELEETNTALGKAIGLLHAMSEEEPAPTPTPSDPSSS